jgi:23S rRNA-/tRNA-specific pseudouridylate synthase
MKKIFIVDYESRMDSWIARQWPHISYSLIHKAIRTKDILLNGKKCSNDSRIEKGDRVSVFEKLLTFDDEVMPVKKTERMDKAIAMIDLEILFENDDVWVVNKPPGMATQGGQDIKISLFDVLKYRCTKLTESLNATASVKNDAAQATDIMKENIEREIHPYIIHRLDKDTSGAIIVAKTHRAASQLSQTIRNRELSKIYIAIVHGIPQESFGCIETGIAKISGKWGEKMYVDDYGDHSITKYKVIGTYKNLTDINVRDIETVVTKSLRDFHNENKNAKYDVIHKNDYPYLNKLNDKERDNYDDRNTNIHSSHRDDNLHSAFQEHRNNKKNFESDDFAVLMVQPITGRKHQIRVHMNHIGHGVVGDLKYNDRKASAKDYSRMLLHAFAIMHDTNDNLTDRDANPDHNVTSLLPKQIIAKWPL